nr:hypothetical protein Iba_chr01bCG2160 [Ipomoea batatas]GME08326.1 hypothetical protein Iba_scaffold7451CG0030 [Ipomoea batatas]GME16306.1 hypothetical protein Iba_scaffold17321CG0010 [Ipomoea batatas]
MEALGAMNPFLCWTRGGAQASTSASSSSFGCTAVKDAAAPAAVEEWVVGELQPQLQAT